MPPRQSTFEALRAAAANWSRRDAIATPEGVQRARLKQWLEDRDDQREPIAFEEVDLARPLPAGTPLLMEGDPLPWFTKLRLHCATPAAWLPLQPLAGLHISRVAPQSLLWHPELSERRHRVGAAVQLRAAAAGDAAALACLLDARGCGAAAALVRRLEDGDGAYEHGSGMVPRDCPSPRGLLLAALGEPEEREWLDELCDGGDDWPGAGKPPTGEARLPGQQPAAPDWIALV